MTDFTSWIEEMELHDPHMSGGKFTWFKGVNHPSAARIDIFLFSMEWEESFKSIRQKLMPRAIMLKHKLKDWSKTNFGEITNKKNSLLEELAGIDLTMESRDLSEATIVVELENMAKNEEANGDRNLESCG
ncbi:hypothetical protein H5410_037015 [Solanum commersonii]|uniref:Uncharacterized protein n=1 Tax=Solanum commersonii TaxID=4109 RepID=A0A9J5Y7B2_SOLCO|nr:hypothetical protein H5410_037015 [Solanum commersonii]